MSILRTLKFCALAMCASVVGTAGAATAITPFAITADRSGVWISGDAGADHVIAKYDNDMNLVFAKKRDGTIANVENVPRTIYPLRDGGVIITSITTGSATTSMLSIDRLDSAGDEIWGTLGTHNETSLIGVDKTGGGWLADRRDLVRLSSSGTLTTVADDHLEAPDASGNGPYVAAVDFESGNVYIAQHSVPSSLLSPYQISKVDSTGQFTPVWTATDTSTVVQFVTVDKNGNINFAGFTSSSQFAMSVDATGNTRWQKTFGSTLTPLVHFAASPDGTLALLGTTLYVFNSTGAQAFTKVIETNPGNVSNDEIAIAPNGDIAVLQEVTDSQRRYLRFDAAGTALATVTVSGLAHLSATLNDGSELIGATKSDTTQALPALVRIARNGASLSTPNLAPLLAASAQLRLDQLGFNGAWYAPAESGQGFTIDYLPSANTIFLPWFTYNVSPTNDASGLAWVTLQGAPAAAGKYVDLTLAITAPGTFDSGIVGAKVVGTGRLSFSDCSTGRLQYQFNADTFGGQGGYIPLTRILPSTTPCTLVNNNTVAAQNTNAPNNGFDARQSGSWYNPATSGQGVELTIIPAGNGFGGFLFAAWFTFDAPPPDDAAHQHWFTLQTGLSTASNGTVTTPILQATGGSLDGKLADTTVSVGTATLTMLGCDTATLHYQFDNSAAAATFKNLSGTIPLTKIAGCTPQ